MECLIIIYNKLLFSCLTVNEWKNKVNENFYLIYYLSLIEVDTFTYRFTKGTDERLSQIIWTQTLKSI